MPEEKLQEQPKEENVSKLIEMVERLEKANAEAKDILAKQNEMIAKNLLGGITDAGVQPAEKKEETPLEYSKRIMSGKI